ncbi:MAG TPA: nitrate reductase molybdenum cofactor assembly chaperone [Burkholderiales bacterium]|nr:nitrate reductase molybdenum cofactor assembly chaperone [Burkholderiales bacterium]
MKTFKVLAALLDYPSEELLAALPELQQALDEEQLLKPATREALRELIIELGSEDDVMVLQEQYVGLFDRVRSLSLHLFEHVHGESRDRGQAMVDLKALYERQGLGLATDELPDYLPAFLEFLAFLPQQEAAKLLADTSHIIEAIGARLQKRRSSYASVFQALLEVAGETGIESSKIADEEIRAEDDPAALDAAWQEQPAFAPGAGCGAATQSAETSVIRFYRGVGA